MYREICYSLQFLMCKSFCDRIGFLASLYLHRAVSGKLPNRHEVEAVHNESVIFIILMVLILW